MRFILFILFILFGFSAVDLCAQFSQPARWEQEQNPSDDPYSVVSLKEEGIALIRQKDKYQNGNQLWDLVIVDTALNQKWATELEMKPEFQFTGYEYVREKVNLMFRRGGSDILDTEIFHIDLETKNIQHFKTEINLQIRLTHYTVVDGNCVFGGYVGKEPVLVIYDPIKNNNIIVPGFFLTDTELLDVRPNKNNTFNILLSQRTQGRKKIIFRSFDKMGNILVEDEIPIEEEKVILSGASSILEHDEVLIAGAYGYNNSKQASGIFSCQVDPFSEQTMRFTEFHQLRHFFDYMSDKKSDKVREKAIQRTAYGRIPEYRTNVGIHRIEEFKGGFAVFGESYTLSSQSSNSNPNPYFNPYYNPTSRAYGYPNMYPPFNNRYYNNPYLYAPTSTFQELRIQQGFVIGYDFKGRRIWDYSIPMNDFKVAGRDQVSDFLIYQDVPHFMYKSGNEVKFSNHSADTLQITEPLSIPIKVNDVFEEANESNEGEGNVRHWYANYFYVWGNQTVKDTKRRSSNHSRRVFFINKIRID